MILSEGEIERYSRQLILPGWSAARQGRLLARSVAIRTDLPACALFLAAAGVGNLTLIGRADFDLEHRISALNPFVRVILLGNMETDAPVDCAVDLPDFAEARGHIFITPVSVRYSDQTRTLSFNVPSGNRVFIGSAAATALLLAWDSEI